MKALLLAGMVVLAGGGAARADVFKFSYTLIDGNVLGASLTGTLQSDGNTFHVAGYNNVTYNGAILEINPTAFSSYTEFDNNGRMGTISNTGILTKDGSYQNFVAYNETTRSGFVFLVNAGYAFSGNQDVTTVGFSDLGDQPFMADKFLATVTLNPVPVPEPASLAFLGIGVAGVAALRRRRQVVRAHVEAASRLPAAAG